MLDMVRRIALLIAVAAAALFASAGAANAYTTTTSTGTVSSATVTSGGSVNFCGGGFAAGSGIAISVNDAVAGSDTASSSGSFCHRVTIQGTGTFVLSARGVNAQGGVNVVTATVLGVKAAGAGAAAGGAVLPRTGSDVGTQMWIAGGLLALGGGLVALTVARRRETGIASA
jgi:LPXTG-motif cell wall-anchored protein